MLRNNNHLYFTIFASILLTLILVNGPAFAHWIESHEVITNLAIQALERDSKSDGDKYKAIVEILNKYKTTLIQGVRDADLRANGIYAIDCQPDGKQCCEIADFSDFIVGDHGFNPVSGEGLYRSRFEFTRIRDEMPMQNYFEHIFRERRSEKADKLYRKLSGNTIAEKIESLKHEMDKSNAFILAELFFKRALHEWKMNHPVDAMYNLGLTLHLVQDLSVPHHVRLIKDDISHGEYEKYVWERYVRGISSISDIGVNYSPIGNPLSEKIFEISQKLSLNPEQSARDSANLAIASSERLFMNFFTNIHPSESIFKLPDTGQTKCYDTVSTEISCTGTVQDGAYNINPMSLKDNGNGTVIDNNTGFLWQKYENASKYNWYQASGTYHATANPTSLSVCGSLNLGGYSDWRLPTKKELITIVDYSIPYPGSMVNKTYFANARVWPYWSSTSYADSPHFAWVVGFDYGFVYEYEDKTQDFGYVRCVRGGQYPKQSFVDNRNGTVTDNKTGIMWQQADRGYMSWVSALSYCEGLSLGGFTDWRLPNIKELESITDDSKYNPALETTYFPKTTYFPIDRTFGFYFSSTTVSDYSDLSWYVHSADGSVSQTSKDHDGSIYARARCARGGQ